jgi:hypothetical protein
VSASLIADSSEEEDDDDAPESAEAIGEDVSN